MIFIHYRLLFNQTFVCTLIGVKTRRLNRGRRQKDDNDFFWFVDFTVDVNMHLQLVGDIPRAYTRGNSRYHNVLVILIMKKKMQDSRS